MGIFTAFSDFLGWMLTSLIGIVGDSGLAIILMTLLFRLILYPLTLKQTRSMYQMKEMQPKQKELQKKYKDKPEEMQKQLMALYKEHNVNPLSSCLPMLLQIPILYGLFLTLRDFQFHDQFLIWDLASRDPYYILPLLAGITTFFQARMTSSSAEPTQRMMIMVMPVMLVVISASFPTGLVLYWITSNLFSIFQQHRIAQRMEAEKGGTASS